MASGTYSGNVRCKKSYQTLHRPTDAAHGSCSQCGDPECEKEFDLGPRVARLNPYYVIGESHDGNRITTLDLLGVRQIELRTSVHLSHRLKNTWREIKHDYSAKSGTDLIVAFDLPEHGSNAGLWMFYKVKRQRDPMARTCRRHAWGVNAGARDYYLFAAAHLLPCSCSTNCAICSVAEEFSLARIRSTVGIDMTSQMKLRDAVRHNIDGEAHIP
jgi:hypothetical protein